MPSWAVGLRPTCRTGNYDSRCRHGCWSSAWCFAARLRILISAGLVHHVADAGARPDSDCKALKIDLEWTVKGGVKGSQ